MQVQEILQRLSFGGDVAEQEPNLGNFFLPTAPYWAFINNEVDLILGAKGTGKSAIARYVCDDTIDIPELVETDIIPAFNFHGSLLFRRLAAADVSRDDETQRDLFATYMVALAGNHVLLKYGALSEHAGKLEARLRAANLIEPTLVNKSIFRRVIARFKPSLEAGLAINESGQPQLTGKASFAPEPPATVSDARVSFDDLEDILDLIANILESVGRRCWILFDRLDEAFPDDPDLERAALRGLLRAHLDIASYGSAVRSKLFLRQDVLQRITRHRGFTNLSHIRTLRISWDSDSMLHMMKLRILDAEILEAWTDGRIDASLDVRQICRSILPRRMRGKDNMDPLVWLLLVTPDSSRSLNPRNLLTLLRGARYHAMEMDRRGEIGRNHTRGLLPARALNVGYEQLSMARLEDTVFADILRVREHVEKLRGKQIRFTRAELAERFEISDQDQLDHAIEELRAVGFLRLLDETLVVPPLYRPALFVAVHGRELSIGLDDLADTEAEDSTTIPDAGTDIASSAAASKTTTETAERPRRARKRARRGHRDGLVDGPRLPDQAAEEDFKGQLEKELGVAAEASHGDSPKEGRATEYKQVLSPRVKLSHPPKVSVGEQLKVARSLSAEGNLEEAFALLIPQLSSTVAALCLGADIAYLMDDEARIDAVMAEMLRTSFNREAAIQGRIFALGLNAFDVDVVRESAANINWTMHQAASIGMIRLLGQDALREWRAYAAWITGTDLGPVPMARTASVIIGSRALAVARGSGLLGDISSPEWTERYWPSWAERYWNLVSDGAVRELHGACYSYARDPESVRPNLLPYQITSLAEILDYRQALPVRLRRELEEMVADRLAVGEMVHLEKYGEWSAFSLFARNVVKRVS